ncbi:MAG TPA: universal stress protein [Candidatus Angelobacter sp.]|nr:universal stress protein [Candidatus Angelobacter sp.]
MSRVEAPPLPSILLASTGKAFEPEVVKNAIELAHSPRSFVHVMSIARIWGTGLGIQHPGLFPTKLEWKAQLEIVGDAVRTLKHAGLDARGGVMATRNPSKVIAREARRLECSTIVIGWQPLSWWMTYLLQDDVWWLNRRSSVPVIAVAHLDG